MSNDVFIFTCSCFPLHLFPLFHSFGLLLVVMSVNSSSSSNASLPLSPLSSLSNMFSLFRSCLRSTAGTFHIIALTIINVLHLSLYVYVLYLGLQRWRQQRSNSRHSDVFTYHMIVAEMMSVLGLSIMFSGALTDLPQMMAVGTYLFFLNLFGERFFHVLTCVERYLAVVHPVTYLSLKKEKWVRNRNITIGCIWLMCIAGTALINIDTTFLIILNYSGGFLIFIVISFCSLSVLCVLIRPGPGEGGGARQQADQSKLRAFYTIMIILGVLLFRFVGMVTFSVLMSLPQLSENHRCALCYSANWSWLPSSLLLPLLFLQRAGKLPCCQKNNK